MNLIFDVVVLFVEIGHWRILILGIFSKYETMKPPDFCSYIKRNCQKATSIFWSHRRSICNSYTTGCPPVRGDNPRALASGLSYVQVVKHGITILYHLHKCRPCTSRDTSC